MFIFNSRYIRDIKLSERSFARNELRISDV